MSGGGAGFHRVDIMTGCGEQWVGNLVFSRIVEGQLSRDSPMGAMAKW